MVNLLLSLDMYLLWCQNIHFRVNTPDLWGSLLGPPLVPLVLCLPSAWHRTELTQWPHSKDRNEFTSSQAGPPFSLHQHYKLLLLGTDFNIDVPIEEQWLLGIWLTFCWCCLPLWGGRVSQQRDFSSYGFWILFVAFQHLYRLSLLCCGFQCHVWLHLFLLF